MEQNVVLAGVGGQGILTIARAISTAGLRRGLNIRQAEVHGMSQRGGAVQSHLRFADTELFSDLIPMGQADLVIAVEPLESLRYVSMLKPDGLIVASTNAFVNIGNYPPIEEVLERIAGLGRHILVDADRLARAAGSARAANVVMLGAASLHLDMSAEELENAVASMFESKGEKVVSVNRRAFRFGRNAASAYLDGIERGGTSRAVRHWIESLSEDQLAGAERPDAPPLDVIEPIDRLSGAEAHAVERLLWDVYEDDRKQLYEHEVYQIIQLVGAISPPDHLFVRADEIITEAGLSRFQSDRVVLKIVSPEVSHKSDAHGIVFCRNDHETVKQEIDRLLKHHAHRDRVDGVLVVEFVQRADTGLGGELFVGVRATREFGPVIAAGLGGIDTEYLAKAMRPGLAVAKALATDISAEDFFDLFTHTAAYDLLSGRARGHSRVVSDGELLRCFRAFISLATRFCVDRGIEGPDVAELEVNPFAYRHQRLIPLDGRGRLRTAVPRPSPRPKARVRNLLEPSSIAVLGVSGENKKSFGRIILNNVIGAGFDKSSVRVIKPGADAIDGVACVPSIADLDEPVDLLVVAAGASELPEIVNQCVDSGKARSAILIPGGAGETEGSEEIARLLKEAVKRAREKDDGPVFLGPNSLGLQSRPGKYDTFFIPAEKLDKRWGAPHRGVALVSQSGAFIVRGMSNFETLDPAFTVSIGNQADLTLADIVSVVGDRDDIHTIGVYAEGFNDLDGLDLLRVIGRLTESGTTVVFYKAGRTDSGRDAAAGHTASVAGDYEICEAGAAHAGALIAEDFTTFNQMLEIATTIHDAKVRGRRVGAIANAGCETVAMADNVGTVRYTALLPAPEERTRAAIEAMLARHRLASLVNARNPLDLTPMAGEQAYVDAARIFLEADEYDAVIVSCIPLTPAVASTEAELTRGSALVEGLKKLRDEFDKPIITVVDAGARYEPFVARLREAGFAVIRSADAAIRGFGRVLASRERDDRPARPAPSLIEPSPAQHETVG
ncbi:MAG: indolepyruvate oxidoreductase subunit beta [Phycisphaeraceae bacterium]|nr:MAG: indolepyruvate oxidoreductase subunit beta [Phycisphaeraceae bacterium]